MKAHGFITLSNNHSLTIEMSDSGDAARVHPNYESKKAKPRWQEIKYDANGDSYITWYGTRYYLHEVLALR